MKKNENNLTKTTVTLIFLLTLIYVIGKILTATPVQKTGNGGSSFSLLSSEKFETATDTATSGTYITFTDSVVMVGKPLQICVVNPKSSTKNWTVSWRVGSSTKSVTESSYTPTAADNESFITATVTASDGTKYETSVYLSSLPVLYVTADESIGDTYVSGSMSMQGNSVYNEENSELYSGNLSIKLRGNSTKDLPKHPYHIKLESKADLLGMGANKHWVLLANSIDHTLIRNKLVYDLSAGLGASYAAESDNVILILNGEYQGVYELCEHIRIANERVDIFDWEDLAEDAAKLIAEDQKQNDAFRDDLESALTEDLSWISSPYTFTYSGKTYTLTDYVDIPAATGGFLLEMDFYHNTENSSFTSLKTNFLQPFYFNKPESAGTSSALTTYARNYLQVFEYALHSNDFVYHDSDIHYSAEGGRFDWNSGWSYFTKQTDFSAPEYDGMHYSDLFDMDSLVNNFLICEFSVNWDSMKNSVIVSKDIDSKAELNPAWDFDWAFGNINMYNIDTYFTDIWQTTDEYFTNEQCYQAIQWNRFLIRDPYFLLQVYDKYQEIRPTLLEDIIKTGGTLDTQYETLLEAAQANDKKWSSTYRAYGGQNFEDAFDDLRSFINERIDWLDEQFTSFDTFVNSLGYYQPSADITVTSVTYQSDGTAVITAAVTNTSAKYASFEVNGTHFYETSITNGQCTVTVDSTSLTDKEHNIVQVRIKDASGVYITIAGSKNNADSQTALSNYKTF